MSATARETRETQTNQQQHASSRLREDWSYRQEVGVLLSCESIDCLANNPTAVVDALCNVQIPSRVQGCQIEEAVEVRRGSPVP